MGTWQAIREAVEELPILDTHEHFLPPGFFDAGEYTLLRILRNSYLSADCITAGMRPTWWAKGSLIHGPVSLDQEHEDEAVDLDELWPFLDRTRRTAYHRALVSGLRHLHGLEGDLNARTWSNVADRVGKAYTREGWFDEILARLRIGLSVVDPYYSVEDPRLWSDRLLPVFEVDDFLDDPWSHPQGGKTASQVAQSWDITLDSLKSLQRAVDEGFDRYGRWGGVATKIGVAYRRTLRFDEATQRQAQEAFSRLAAKEGGPAAVLVLGNFMVRHILRASIEAGFPVQVHTGYQCGYLDQGRPTHLVNLIQEFPEARFVLFHGGYPFAEEAGLLAKAFPNVYLDLCWMPLLSTAMTAPVLARWLDLVPHTKIMWGGDVWSVEECSGAVKLFKDVLASTLSQKMDEQGISLEEALDIASSICYRNACELFEIPEEHITE